MFFILIAILKIFSVVIPLLISVAYFTIAERKMMGAIQRRKGPNVIGFMGLLQPFADGLKLFAKETTFPTSSNISVFLLAPSLTFVLSLIGWAVIPFSEGIVLCDLNLGILYLLCVSALNVYGILFAGWSSNVRFKWVLFGFYLKSSVKTDILSALRALQRKLTFLFSIIWVLLGINKVSSP